MRLVVVSMSSCLGNVVRGVIPVEQIEGSDVYFYFGCAREHMFDPGLPSEASWTNKTLPKLYGGRLTDDDVDPDKLDTVKRVLDVFKAADADGRVKWRCGHYTAVIRQLHPSQFVFYGGQLQQAHHWS
jgi:hypothetical protein